MCRLNCTQSTLGYQNCWVNSTVIQNLRNCLKESFLISMVDKMMVMIKKMINPVCDLRKVNRVSSHSWVSRIGSLKSFMIYYSSETLKALDMEQKKS